MQTAGESENVAMYTYIPTYVRTYVQLHVIRLVLSSHQDSTSPQIIRNQKDSNSVLYWLVTALSV